MEEQLGERSLRGLPVANVHIVGGFGLRPHPRQKVDAVKAAAVGRVRHARLVLHRLLGRLVGRRRVKGAEKLFEVESRLEELNLKRGGELR